MLRFVGALLLLSVVAVLVVNLTVWGTEEGKIITAEQAATLEEPFDCILVLGAGVWADGSPSPMLQDRLEVAMELYFSEVSDRLLMSGDHMQHDYNEVGVMKQYAVSAGVPSEVIFLDHAGLSTYESVWRAKEIYEAERILIVTQEYHLYRALYIADALGMEAYGVAADLRPYKNQTGRDVREWVARVKDFAYAHIQPKSTYLGDSVDLRGNGDATNDNPLF